MKTSSLLVWATAIASGAATQSQVANAQNTTALEEVIVQAQRRSQDLQQVPIAVTSMSDDELASSNVFSVQDLSSAVSGFVGPGDNGMQSPHIRGIGSQLATPGLENSVALYVDGVYISSPAPALLGMNHVQQVEVLKGPQGTLFGRNTTGGLVHITTRNPGDKGAVEAEVGYANFDKINGSAYFNLPVSDTVATNLSVSASSQGEGWGKNLFNGAPAYRTDLNLVVRNKWDFRFSDATRLHIAADYEKINETGTFSYRPTTGALTNVCQTGIPETAPPPGCTFRTTASGWDTQSDEPGPQRDLTRAYGIAARISHDFSFATLTDTLAYRHTQFDLLSVDADKTPLSYFYFSFYALNKQLTNELQLASNNGDRLNWTLGTFAFHATDDTDHPLVWGTLAPVIPNLGRLLKNGDVTRITSDSIAAYGQLDYRLTDATTLTAGLRYSNDKHKIVGHGTLEATLVPFTVFPDTTDSFSKGAVSARLALTQQLTPSAMVYGSFNRGTKAGGYNPIVIANQPYTDEKLDAFELGTKLSFLDNSARLNVAAFYNKYDDLQVQKFPPGLPPQIYNGANAKSYGVDVDFEIRPVASLTVRTNLEALHTEFIDFPNADITTASPFGGFIDATINPVTGLPLNPRPSVEGNPLPLAPKFTSSITPTYSIPVGSGNLDLSASWSYNSGFTTSPGMELNQPAYNLFGANVTFTGQNDGYFVRLWGANLSNELVTMTLFPAGTNEVAGYLAPRTFGLTFGRRFL